MQTNRISVVAVAVGMLTALGGCDPMDMLDRVGSCGVYGSDAACDSYSSRYSENQAQQQAAADYQYEQSLQNSEMERLNRQYIQRSPATSIDMANWSWLNGAWCDKTTHAETFVFEIKASGRSAMFIYNPNLKVAYSYNHGYAKDNNPLGYYVSPRYWEGFHEIWIFSQYGTEFYKVRTIFSKVSDTRFFIKSNARMTFGPQNFEPIWRFSRGESAYHIRDSSNKTDVYSYYKCEQGAQQSQRQREAAAGAANVQSQPHQQAKAANTSTAGLSLLRQFQHHVQEARQDEKAARIQHPDLGWLNGMWCTKGALRSFGSLVGTRIKVLDPGRLMLTEVHYETLSEITVSLARVGDEFEYRKPDGVYRIRKDSPDGFTTLWIETIDQTTGRKKSKVPYNITSIRCTDNSRWGV